MKIYQLFFACLISLSCNGLAVAYTATETRTADAETTTTTAGAATTGILTHDILGTWTFAYTTPAESITFYDDGRFMQEKDNNTINGTYYVLDNTVTFTPTVNIVMWDTSENEPVSIADNVLTILTYPFTKSSTTNTTTEVTSLEATVADDLTINLPKLSYQGLFYSVRLDFNADFSAPCWGVNDIKALSGMQASRDDPSVADNFTITIPKLNYQANYYSAILDFNGSCWTVREVIPITSSTASTTTSSSAIKATVGHSGFDFSKNVIPDWDNTDLYMVWWTNATYPEGYANGDGVWATSWDSTIIPVQDQGVVSLDSVTTIPTDWTASSTRVDFPLQKDHVYISKARDGYVKFKVLSLPSIPIDPNVSNVDVKVEYVYTSGNSF